jgi:hypothetical protein
MLLVNLNAESFEKKKFFELTKTKMQLWLIPLDISFYKTKCDIFLQVNYKISKLFMIFCFYINVSFSLNKSYEFIFVYFFSNGCATSEDLFWKLDALQSFIGDLHWPDPEFAQHLNQRLKHMACDMMESCIQR